MSTTEDPATEGAGKRILEDTLGATWGAAAGAGLSTVIGLVLPLLFPVLPLGVVGGAVAGILIKELAQKKRTTENVPNTDRR
jgi:hypothetical protein